MSVTAAAFLNSSQMTYAAGAPRAAGTGQVVLFAKNRAATMDRLAIMSVVQIISGEQFASSFGYEVATADVNGDKLVFLLNTLTLMFKTNQQSTFMKVGPTVKFVTKKGKENIIQLRLWTTLRFIFSSRTLLVRLLA